MPPFGGIVSRATIRAPSSIAPSSMALAHVDTAAERHVADGDHARVGVAVAAQPAIQRADPAEQHVPLSGGDHLVVGGGREHDLGAEAEEVVGAAPLLRVEGAKRRDALVLHVHEARLQGRRARRGRAGARRGSGWPARIAPGTRPGPRRTSPGAAGWPDPRSGRSSPASPSCGYPRRRWFPGGRRARALSWRQRTAVPDHRRAGTRGDWLGW